MEIKRKWCSPIAGVQTFVAQEYIAACFTYEAMLVCEYGAAYPDTTGGPDGRGCYETNGAQHGEPCANSTIRVSVVNGVATYEGHEGGNKTDIHLENVVIPGIEQQHQPGDPLYNCEWTSTLGGTYHHKGSGTVTRWIYDESVTSTHS